MIQEVWPAPVKDSRGVKSGVYKVEVVLIWCRAQFRDGSSKSCIARGCILANDAPVSNISDLQNLLQASPIREKQRLILNDAFYTNSEKAMY